MNGFSVKLGRDYAIDVAGLYQVRKLKDGITVADLEVGGSWYRGDHNPSFTVRLMAMNFMILEVTLYNVHHVEDA